MTQYVEDTYTKIAQSYTDEFFTETSDLPFVDQLASCLAKGAKVLDIGCGPGQFCKYLSNKGFAVQGIDVTDEMLAIAKAKVPDVLFTKMDMRQLDFADCTFEGVLAAYSIIHIPTNEVPGVLREIQRVLCPGGYALFIVQEGKPDQILDEPLLPGAKIFVNFFTKERLKGLLDNAGFRVVQQVVGQQASGDVLSGTVIWTLASKQKN